MSTIRIYENPYTVVLRKIIPDSVIDKDIFDTTNLAVIYLISLLLWISVGLLFVGVGAGVLSLLEVIAPSVYASVFDYYVLSVQYISEPVGVGVSVFVAYSVILLTRKHNMKANRGGTVYSEVFSSVWYIGFTVGAVVSGLMGLGSSVYWILFLFSVGYFAYISEAMMKDDMGFNTASRFYPIELWLVLIKGLYFSGVAFVVAGGVIEVGVLVVAVSYGLSVVYLVVRTHVYHQGSGSEMFVKQKARYYKYKEIDSDTGDVVSEDNGQWYLSSLLFSDSGSEDTTTTSTSENQEYNVTGSGRAMDRSGEIYDKEKVEQELDEGKTEFEENEWVSEATVVGREKPVFEPTAELVDSYEQLYSVLQERELGEDLDDPQEFKGSPLAFEEVWNYKDGFIEARITTQDEELEDALTEMVESLNDFIEKIESEIDVESYEFADEVR